MKGLNYRGLLPENGLIAVLGKDIEEGLVKAVAYAQAEGKKVFLAPLTPKQVDLVFKLDVDTRKGYPDYFYVELDFEPREGYFTVGNCDSPMLLRLYEMGADKTVVFLRRKYHTVSVEYTSFLREEIEPIISLFGEIVARRENAHENTVVDIVPLIEDVEELRKKLKDIPGVAEVGIFPIVPYKKIVLKR